jgi:hypothetical protein
MTRNFTQDNIPTQAELNVMAKAYRRFSGSYNECKRKMKTYKMCKRLAWCLFGADIYFTYQGVTGYSGSWEFGLSAAVLVGVLQWQVSESVLSRGMRSLFQPDKNGDETITPDEWLRLALVWGSLIVAYGLDIATNALAIDIGTFGSIPFDVLNLPANGFLVNLLAFFICLILACGDEVIHTLADNRLAQLEEEIPALRERAAMIQGKLEAATGFSYEYLKRAEEQGRKKGASYPI